MVSTVKVLLFLSLIALSGCYKGDLPSYSYDRQAGKSHKSYAAYTVRRGDTLYSIGKRFGVSHKLLAWRNRIRYPYTIYVGQRLSLTRNALKSEYMPLPKQHQAKKATVAKASKKQNYRKHAIQSVRLRWPLKGKITSKFGRRGSRMHDGLDIAAKEGAPIYAAASGEIVYSDQRLTGYGKLIIVRHSRDVFTAYAHNQKNLVRKGEKVKAGEMIARVGQTGRASGPHLHFEVRRGTTPVDPIAYLPRR